jgi:hypothetical protein
MIRRYVALCDKLDKAGATASALCAFHCAFMPLLLALLPAAALSPWASEWFEWALLLLAAVLGCVSVHFGTRIHGRRWTWLLLSSGVLWLAIGRLAHERDWGVFGVVAMALGGLIVMCTHLINRWLCKRCPKCS